MKTRRIKHIDLALQGGGAHGAFTWGVLDRLLEDERLEIDGVSGTSAGAMNAVVLADGLAADGRRGARDALRRFWREVSRASSINPLTNPLGALFAGWASDASPFQPYMNLVSQLWSPSQFNPFNLNPLHDILVKLVDFERLRHCRKVQLFIAATNVRTGALREFRIEELTADAVMASACLPLVFRAVEIDGEAYWDGGYLGNPSLLPLIDESPAHDLVLVQINPVRREQVPTQVQEITDRINEITFNSSLVKELRSVALLKKLIADEHLPKDRLQGHLFRQVDDLLVHRIAADSDLARLGASTKMSAEWSVVSRLHRTGRATANDWLEKNFTHLGRRSTVKLEDTTVMS
jgi:NTE family protein